MYDTPRLIYCKTFYVSIHLSFSIHQRSPITPPFLYVSFVLEIPSLRWETLWCHHLYTVVWKQVWVSYVLWFLLGIVLDVGDTHTVTSKNLTLFTWRDHSLQLLPPTIRTQPPPAPHILFRDIEGELKRHFDFNETFISNNY